MPSSSMMREGSSRLMEAVPVQVTSSPASRSSASQAGAVSGRAPTLIVREMLLRISSSSSRERSARRASSWIA